MTGTATDTAKTLLCVSDIHGDFDRFAPHALPDADALLIAGDLTNYGMRQPFEVRQAEAWMLQMAAKYQEVRYVLGNHDLDIPFGYFEQTRPKGDPWVLELRPERCMRSARLEATLCGINLSPCFISPRLKDFWRDMTDSPKTDKAAFDTLDAADIVVSHCPPQGILDGKNGESYGSPGLRKYLFGVAPRLLICGHIHESQGVRYVDVFNTGGQVCVVNTACVATLVTIPKTGEVRAHVVEGTRPV